MEVLRRLSRRSFPVPEPRRRLAGRSLSTVNLLVETNLSLARTDVIDLESAPRPPRPPDDLKLSLLVRATLLCLLTLRLSASSLPFLPGKSIVDRLSFPRSS